MTKMIAYESCVCCAGLDDDDSGQSSVFDVDETCPVIWYMNDNHWVRNQTESVQMSVVYRIHGAVLPG